MKLSPFQFCAFGNALTRFESLIGGTDSFFGCAGGLPAASVDGVVDVAGDAEDCWVCTQLLYITRGQFRGFSALPC